MPQSVAGTPVRHRRLKSRIILSFCLILLVLTGCLGHPTYLWMRAWWHDQPFHETLAAGDVDDASRLNRTKVKGTVTIPADREAAEQQLVALVEKAKAERIPIAIAGARHSMGGHTIAPDGIVLDMLPFRQLQLDESRKILTAGSGARWFEIIPYLDARGYSVGVMQSNNNFTVGGSISVNCHGWQHNKPPIASTVESFRLLKADGQVVRCSRTENQELFSLVLGGYGLFGIILDVELRIVPNELYRPDIEFMPAEQYVARFKDKVNGSTDAGMVYGRLCVVPGDKTFLREAILTVFREAPHPQKKMPELKALGYAKFRREVYRAQIDSDAGKSNRWSVEKMASRMMRYMHFSRNQLLNESAETFQEQNADRTDILHEYFIPPAQVPVFLEQARTIIPKHQGNLMNVTIRNVLEDKDAFLRYADQEMFAFVMLFNQLRTEAADQQMQAMTRKLIEAALRCQGRYYLPYRLHATSEQFHQAYPQARAFFEKKRQYDPEGIFQNQFYGKYGR